jgi:hypothetical protein
MSTIRRHLYQCAVIVASRSVDGFGLVTAPIRALWLVGTYLGDGIGEWIINRTIPEEDRP